MPIAPTYPGVYIEEVPSGVRTITGVATSITAFIGRARRGPVNKPVTINGFADFERRFGGLWIKSTLGFAVQSFFLNGGAQAIIVRLHRDGTTAELPLDNKVTLSAYSPGSWANQLEAKVDHNVDELAAKKFGVDKTELFNLTITDSASGETELFRNLTAVESARRIDRVLEQESQLVRASLGNPPARPSEDTYTLFAQQGDDGDHLIASDVAGSRANKEGLYALEDADLFNLLCIPPLTPGGDVGASLWSDAAAYCEERRAMLLIDPPTSWGTKDLARDGISGINVTSKNAAIFFPRVRQANPLREGQLEDFAPSGAVAGVFARTDAERGVWKAPAGLDATLRGVRELTVPLTDAENGELNPLGINCLRIRPAVGPVVWGSRTRQGDDRLASEWKYVPVRRLALFIEESLYRGTQWVVFEPNDEPLWAQIRLNVGAFMQNLFRQGAFQGSTPRDAYFVKCDKETTTQNDIDRGIVNVLVGFAPLKPAEFVIIKIQQIAGQIQT